MKMRRGGGYNNQTAVMHNNSPHGGHHQHHRIGGAAPNRMYHQSQPPQMVPYGHVNSPRPLSFPSPSSLSVSNNSVTTPQHYSGGVSNSHGSSSNSGGGSSSNNRESCNYTSSPPTPSVPSSGPVVGGDMPPVETVVARLETACRLLHGIGGNNTRVNEIGVEIQILSEDLRRVGPLLETAYPDVLDRVMSSMRDASAQPSLPPSLRLAIFELVELRASKWLLPSDSSNYYRQRRNINDAGDVAQDSPVNQHYNSRPAIAVPTNCKPEVIFQSGSSSLGTSPIPPANSDTSTTAKTYREEVIIKNSDSGKVMGVRGRRVHIIEAISDTIISFEKVAPTAKERVLSINGYSQQSINMAKQLIQETIQRNASPVFDGLVTSGSEYGLDGEGDADSTVANALKKMQPPSKSDDDSRFSYSVTLGEEVIKISGRNLQFVQEAKLAMDDYFSQKYPELFFSSNNLEDEEEFSEAMVQLVPKYDRTTLLSLSLVKIPPPDFTHLEPEVKGSIILEKSKYFDPEKFCREMSGGLKTGQNWEGVAG